MKFETTRDHLGRMGIVAIPGDYDGYPIVNTLWIEGPGEVPTKSPDRFAVACVLAFGSYCSGELDFGRKISPATANAIRRYQAPVGVSVSAIEQYPKALPIADGTLSIRMGGGMPDNEAAFSLQLLDTHRFAGSLRTSSSLIASSNASVLQHLSASRGGRRDAVATAIFCLLAEELGADRARLQSDVAAAENPRVQELLGAVRLELIGGAA